MFPVICNGHLLLDYDKNIPDGGTGITSDDATYGIWDLEGSFTLEAIVTAYDCNGNSSSTIKNSTKTLPNQTSANSQSRRFLDIDNRLTHSMCIFYSTNMQLYLVNTASSYSNTPAEYKIQFVVTASGGTSTLNSPAVIKGTTGYNTNPEALYLLTPYHIAVSFSSSTGSMDIIVNGVIIASMLHAGKGVTNMAFSMDNTDCYIGTINSSSGEAATRKQFMGELHELCLTKGYQTDFSDIHTLIPFYETLLLYLRFEEVDI